MPEFKVTPGPWYVISAFGRSVVVFDEKTDLGSCKSTDFIDCNSSGNASLVSAAPDMFDALRNWQIAERMGDKKELRKAKTLRDLALKKALGL